jgi:hypothetical protein
MSGVTVVDVKSGIANVLEMMKARRWIKVE